MIKKDLLDQQVKNIVKNIRINWNYLNFKKTLGLLLGDVSAERSKANINTRLRFDQSKEKHSEYIMHLYDLFKDFVGSSPSVTNRKADKRTGKIYNSIYFKTLAFPCLLSRFILS